MRPSKPASEYIRFKNQFYHFRQTRYRRTRFYRLSAAVPGGVQLGFHLCYGDREGRHFIEPENTTRMVELTNLITSTARHIEFIHMPVPIARDDDAFYAPLQGLQLDSNTRDELIVGLTGR